MRKPAPARIAKPPSRRQQQKRRRQQEILNAAFDVFAARGYEASRIDDVARRASIAKGTIYLYFRDKERLFQAVVRNLIPKRFDVLVDTVPGPPEKLLAVLLSHFYQNVVRNEKVSAVFRMLVAESARFPQLAEIYHQEIIVPGIRALRKVLKRGVAEGVFQKIKALEFPQILVAPGLLAMIWQLLFGRHHALDLDAYMKAHGEFVLQSLKHT